MSARRPLVAGNWKMHKTVSQARVLARELRDALDGESDGVEIVICPPFVALAAVADALDGTTIALGAQNVNANAEGAYTGEISPLMLREVGATHVIIGHSERRSHDNETDASVNRKVKSALAHGLTPIVAVGETRDEHDDGRALERVRAQTEIAFLDVAFEDVARCIVAYEPIWAIGSGESDTPEGANAVIAGIRASVRGLEGARILYGGSMKPGNAAAFCAQPDIDGGLIGGASLVAADFAAIVAGAAEAAAV